VKTIFADYNAKSEAGHVCLTTRGSQEDILRLGLRSGDWVWLSDGEVVVGAQLAVDDRYGLVGVPDWDTLVHLDDEGAGDFEGIKAELNPLLSKETRSSEDDP
jgi:formylmethanofuran dehydrogenase subunit D